MVEQVMVCQHCGLIIGYSESDLSIYALMQMKCGLCKDKKWLWGITDLKNNNEWFKVTENLKWLFEDKYPNPHEWCIQVDNKERTMKVMDST